MTDIEHAQWIRQFWHDKLNEIKTDLNEAVRIAYQQGRKDALEEVKAEIEQNAYPIVHGVNNHEKGMTLYGILQVIDKYKGIHK